MKKAHPALGICAALAMLAGGTAHAQAQQPVKAEVIHWWTSGGESAAVKELAKAFDAAGGAWVDNAIAGNEAARTTAVNRIIGGSPPAAAQFNTSKQFLDLIDSGMLNNIDEVAQKNNWDRLLPAPLVSAIKIKGHYYAAPVNVHMPAWIWYSKAALAKAGVAGEPATPEEFFAALDKLKAAGLVPLALGGQPWQEKITFEAVLAQVGGVELYQAFYKPGNEKVIQGPAFRKVLESFKRLKSYVDPGSPNRNWNDATSMVITGKAGFQIMGDWAKGEFSAARQTAGKEFGCIAGFGPKSPYIVAGDAFVFPKTSDPAQVKAQKLLAETLTAPATQVAFNIKKGSVPIRTDVDAKSMDICAQAGLKIMQDPSRQVPGPQMLVTPDVDGALRDALTKYWNSEQSTDDALKSIAAAFKS